MLEVCYRCGVKVVTVYAFSVENFQRSRYEVDALMSLMKLKLMQMSEHGELFERYGASVRILGERDLLAPDVLEAIDRAEEITKNNKAAILNVCFPYTARNEITMAIRDTVEDWSQPVPEREWAFSKSHIEHKIRSSNLVTEPAKVNGYSPSPGATSDTDDSTIESLQPITPPSYDQPAAPKSFNPLAFPDPEAINAETLTDHMYTSGMPPVDLLIRTSGVERLSDFMLWQVHEKTDVKFVSCLWPEFDLWHFIPVLVEWQWRRRKESEEQLGWRRKDRRFSKKVQ
jgi:ditrans,polycis-polyprenyl diphosphate synthase